MQLVLVLLLLKVTFIAEALLSLNIIVETLEAATQQVRSFYLATLGEARRLTLLRTVPRLIYSRFESYRRSSCLQ